MMISKDIFIETMLKLEKLDQKMDKVDSALKDLCKEFGGFYLPDPFDLVMNLLVEVFNDTNNWLNYLVYECDFLNDYDPSFASDENDQPIVLNNWGDVYDLLIKFMKEE